MKKIVVDCERNDPVDIRCGGPQYLGFDFFVKDEEVEGIEKFIRSECSKFDVPCIAVYIEDEDRPNVKVWTRQMISECIEEGY